MDDFGGHCQPDNRLIWHELREDLADQLDAVLGGAQDERPLQAFFEQHPFVLPLALLGGLHQYSWVFPQPRLGNGIYIPDFVACDRDSLGFQWKLVELESPTASATNKDDSVSHACHHAVQQIRDYKRWLRDNLGFERQHGWHEITGECESWIVIGRRGDRSEIARERLADFKKESIAIHSYDHIVEGYRHAQAYINSEIRRIEEFARVHGPFPGLAGGGNH